MQAISWTASQAATMAQVIPVIALALGLELREVRKYFDDMAPELSQGKHATKKDDERSGAKAAAKTDKEKEASKAVHAKKDDETVEIEREFLTRKISRYALIGFWGCVAMIVLLVGEQSSIAIVLGRSPYNNLNEESLAIRAALTIVFLSPVAQLILSFMEAGFRRKKTSFRQRYRLGGAAIVVMTTLGFIFTFRGY